MKFLSIWGALLFAFLLIGPFNFHGWGQRVFWDQKPPFHWRTVWESYDETLNKRNVQIDYVGENGKTCATIFYAPSAARNTWQVYGFGFNDNYASIEYARSAAERECR